jgi:predicted nucleic acid-binding Zn ribbon protein
VLFASTTALGVYDATAVTRSQNWVGLSGVTDGAGAPIRLNTVLLKNVADRRDRSLSARTMIARAARAVSSAYIDKRLTLSQWASRPVSCSARFSFVQPFRDEG